MKMVIDISDETYKFIQETSFVENTDTMFSQNARERKQTMMLFDILDAIKKGTPLPKGHGRLIDEKDLSLMTVHMIDGMFVCDAPTIIEAECTYKETGCGSCKRQLDCPKEADKGVLEKINEKQDSLRAVCKAWDEEIEKNGYVN